MHGASQRLTAPSGPRPAETVTQDERGHFHLHSFEAARQVLRSDDVRQAGFMAERVNDVPGLGRAPVLFAEGEHHHEMRRSTARYFTPVAVEGYQDMMARLADRLIADFVARGRANLDDLSLKMAVNVAAQVVGLTSSAVPGMERRVMSFVDDGLDATPDTVHPGGKLRGYINQSKVLSFFLLDVKPAILARRRAPREDLISYLLERGYTDLEILTECLTYGTAGMVTTREFISAAAWHFLSDASLKNEYLHAPEAERHAILQELLRLEPVVSQLYRRTLNDLEVDGVQIPAGSVLTLDLLDTNSDPALLGDSGEQVCPMRTLPRGVQPPVLAFGDGHHRCPGAFLAIRESDVFLRRLLMLDVRLVSPPSVTFNETVRGYELRGFTLALD
ncbi:hypothetical protein GCM10008957_20320 [Deinococcus ruber]|uniref:Cytochrome P450 n=1 Tax=Deinococcus ruber TaxID=1848197 RepID=A0A918C6F9_9DEIO|nr:hypothetical protein GCM10008957_20320 [Deinococcus ruber]